MQAELEALEAHYKGLQMLVGELLVTNQQLRAEIAKLKLKSAANVPAIHPQSRPDR